MSAQQLKNHIGGEWVGASGAGGMDVINPATGETLAHVTYSSADDIAAAVSAAKSAFPAWRRTPPLERARCLFRFKNLLEEHQEELARIVTTENGKTIA